MKFNNRNVYISPKANIGNNVKIGDNTTIYDHVSIGDNSIIANDCVIGEPTHDYYSNPEYINPPTSIGENVLIRSHAIIYASCTIGNHFQSGHRITIREKTVFGTHCRVGTKTDIQGYATFGNHCWMHSNVFIAQKTRVGNFVFIYPYVVLTDDPTPPSNICIGPSIDDYSQIAACSILLPGVKIGKHCLVGAGSIVGKDVADYQLVLGNPAKVIKDVREIKSRESGESHYPWPYNFERGMPWEGIGFENWENEH